MYDIYELNEKSLVELKEIALQLGVENVNLPKNELVYCIIDQQAVHPDIIKDKKEKDDSTATEAAAVEKPKKRGRKIATSRPDKEFFLAKAQGFARLRLTNSNPLCIIKEQEKIIMKVKNIR